MKKYRKVLKYIWLSLLATVLLLYIFRPNYFTSEFLANALDGNEQLISIVYVAFVLLRSLFFIPSTLPLLIGIALFPGRLDFLLIVNMIGIMGGSILLYYAANFFTPDDFFSSKQIKGLQKVKEKINRFGFSIVLVWSFIPIVPTDLICYVSGATKMNLAKFLVSLFIGELLLVSLYIFTGKELIDLFF